MEDFLRGSRGFVFLSPQHHHAVDSRFRQQGWSGEELESDSGAADRDSPLESLSFQQVSQRESRFLQRECGGSGGDERTPARRLPWRNRGLEGRHRQRHARRLATEARHVAARLPVRGSSCARERREPEGEGDLQHVPERRPIHLFLQGHPHGADRFDKRRFGQRWRRARIQARKHRRQRAYCLHFHGEKEGRQFRNQGLFSPGVIPVPHMDRLLHGARGGVAR